MRLDLVSQSCDASIAMVVYRFCRGHRAPLNAALIVNYKVMKRFNIRKPFAEAGVTPAKRDT
jgi:hypothetical protein